MTAASARAKDFTGAAISITGSMGTAGAGRARCVPKRGDPSIGVLAGAKRHVGATSREAEGVPARQVRPICRMIGG